MVFLLRMNSMDTAEQHRQRIRQLHETYRAKKREIVCRLREFSECLSKKNDEEVFSEMAFCILTPQSKARSCWDAIQTVKRRNLLLTGSEKDIKRNLRGVRFHNKKAHFLVKAREFFQNPSGLSVISALKQFTDARECREWLVKNIKGLGYKEASHFLRNIGLGGQIAILDRHILKNLCQFGVIRKIPASLSRAQYVMIEQKMAAFSREIQIPLDHLDLLLWYTETGEIFK